jgi:hypothetical protein
LKRWFPYLHPHSLYQCPFNKAFFNAGLDSLRRRRESPFEADYLGNVVDTNSFLNQNSALVDDSAALSPFSYNGGDDRADIAQGFLNIEQLLALDPETSGGLKQLSPDLYDDTEENEDDEDDTDDDEDDGILVYDSDDVTAADYQMGEDKDDDEDDYAPEPVLDIDTANDNAAEPPESVLDIDATSRDEPTKTSGNLETNSFKKRFYK